MVGVVYLICPRVDLDGYVPHTLRPDPRPSAALWGQTHVGTCRQRGSPIRILVRSVSWRRVARPAGVHSDVLPDPYPAEKTLKHFIIELLGSRGEGEPQGKVLEWFLLSSLIPLLKGGETTGQPGEFLSIIGLKKKKERKSSSNRMSLINILKVSGRLFLSLSHRGEKKLKTLFI